MRETVIYIHIYVLCRRHVYKCLVNQSKTLTLKGKQSEGGGGSTREEGGGNIFTTQKSGRYVLQMQKYIRVTPNLMFYMRDVQPAVRHVVFYAARGHIN